MSMFIITICVVGAVILIAIAEEVEKVFISRVYMISAAVLLTIAYIIILELLAGVG